MTEHNHPLKTSNKTTIALTEAIVEGIKEKKGKHITLIDMRSVEESFCDYMIVAEGNTATQVGALEGAVWDKALKMTGEKPIHTHTGSGEWIAMDYVDVVVHIMVPELRNYYGLEQMWADAKQTIIPDEE